MFAMKMVVVHYFILLLIYATSFEVNAAPPRAEKDLIDSILSRVENDVRTRPPAVNGSVDGPVEVDVTFYVRRIYRIDDEKMLYNLDVTFRNEWLDERLKYAAPSNVPFLTLQEDDVVWTPDCFFNDYKSSVYSVMKPNILLRIYPDGKVLLSKRLNLLLNCDMEFSKFPFDQQTCVFLIESYSYSGADILFKWKNNDSGSAVTITKNLANIPLFTLEKTWTESGHVKVTTGTYSFLKLNFLFSRELNYYLVQVFIPCTMLVVAAYGVFWINPVQISARLLLAVATLYTGSLTLSIFSAEAPRAPCTKAIDIFTGLSLTFMFAALIETIFVHFIEERKRNENDGEETLATNATGHKRISGDKINGMNQMKSWLMKNSSNKIDAFARIIYPAAFIFFQVLYWSVCLAF